MDDEDRKFESVVDAAARISKHNSLELSRFSTSRTTYYNKPTSFFMGQLPEPKAEGS